MDRNVDFPIDICTGVCCIGISIFQCHISLLTVLVFQMSDKEKQAIKDRFTVRSDSK